MESLKAYSMEPTDAGIEPANTGRFGARFLGRTLDMVVGFCVSLIAGVLGGVLMVILAQMGKVPQDWMERLNGAGFLANLG